MEVLVVGAGASGLMAAIVAAKAGAKVTLLESMDKPGKKLLATGNGRCNLTNGSVKDGREYRTGEPKGVDAVLKAFTAKDTVDFFERLGLLLKTREGELFYPYSDQAQSVLDVLLWEAGRLNVKIKCREKVVSIEKAKSGFFIKTEGWQYRADRVILSAGGKAAPATGSDGSGYVLAKALGHTIVPVLPALVPLTVKEPFVKSLEGVRSRTRLRLLADERKLKEEEGELQWTSYGISGIVVFQLSSLAVRALKGGKKVTIAVDLFPDFSLEKLKEGVLPGLEEGKTYEKVLGGFFHKKVLTALFKSFQVKPSEKAEKETIFRLLETAKGLFLTVSGSRSFEQAQVCSGGVPLSEINWETMESKKKKGLYLTGELLDADGPCGGYNLQWAWATGYLAGIHGGKEER